MITESNPQDLTIPPNKRREIVSEANQRQESMIALHDDLQQAISKAADHAARLLSASSEPLTLIVKLNEQQEIEQVYEPVAYGCCLIN